MKKLTPYLISLTMVVIFSLVHLRIDTNPNLDDTLSSYGPIRELDRSALDFKFNNQSADELPEPQVVIASIDEKSVEKYGLWPWPRSLTGDFIRTAGEGGAAVIAFDVAFVDEDRNNVRPSVQRLRQKLLDSKLGPDGGLAVLEERLQQTLTAKERQRLLPLIEDLRDSSREFLERLDDEIGVTNPDELMAAAIKSHPNTVLGMMGYHSTEDFIDLTLEDMVKLRKDARRYSINTVFDPAIILIDDQEIAQFTPASRPIEELAIENVTWEGFHLPLEILRNEAQFVGSFNAIPDPDGPIRSMPLVFKYDDFLMPSLRAGCRTLQRVRGGTSPFADRWVH